MGNTKYPRANIYVSATQSAGVVTSGYRISFQASASGTIKEVGIYRLGGSPLLGELFYDCIIKPDTYYDFTITTAMNVAGQDKITVTGAGINVTVKYPAAKIAYTNGVALGAFGGATVSYDYLGAGTGGKFSSDLLQSDALANILKGSSGVIANTPGYYAGFNDLVREIYVEDVRFSKGPATRVAWYPSVNHQVDNIVVGDEVANVRELACAISNVGPWGARLAIANVGLRAVLLDSPETNQFPLVYGNIVEELQQIEMTSKNDASIIKFGENKLEIDSKWLTNRKAAQDQLDWLITTMAGGREIHTINSFDNPLVEVGDIVTIDYTKKGITTATKYVVIRISRSWSAGLDTNVTVVKV
jgi:hypothetical protein